jgi:hypothetical protein
MDAAAQQAKDDPTVLLLLHVEMRFVGLQLSK